MRHTIRPLLLSGLLFLTAACTSNDEKPEMQSAGAASVTCICGTPEAAFDGCPHPLCLSGEGNPANPDCVCGPLEFEAGKE